MELFPHGSMAGFRGKVRGLGGVPWCAGDRPCEWCCCKYHGRRRTFYENVLSISFPKG